MVARNFKVVAWLLWWGSNCNGGDPDFKGGGPEFKGGVPDFNGGGPKFEGVGPTIKLVTRL